MDGHATATAAQDRGGATARVAAGLRARPVAGAAPADSRWRDVGLVALLLVAAAGLRAWHLTHTEVSARDSIGYIRYAWQLDHHPWLNTLRDERQQQHPGYPFAVLAASHVVRRFDAGPATLMMQISAQLASCVASVLLVVPTFFLGRALFDRRTGFWASLVFQCLPAAGRLFADGLSEGTFLLFAATALLMAVYAFRDCSRASFALTGLFGGLAYWVRPEGALIVGATGLVLLALQAVRSRRLPWRRFLACGASLSLAALAVGAPLVAITGKLTVKPTANHVFDPAGEATPPAPPVLGRGEPPFAVWLPEENHHALGGLRALVTEFGKGSYYVGWVPMLLGLWWFRDRFRLLPGAWVLLLVSVVILGLMWRVAALLGYVSDRHLIVPILCGTYWAVAAVPKLVAAAAALLGRLPWLARLGRRLPAAASPAWAALLLLGLAGAALPKTLEPLHANRSGFKDAGLWLADNRAPWDEIIDPYGWSHYYAGNVFLEGAEPAVPPGVAKKYFIVLEEAGREHSRLPDLQKAIDTAKRGHPVHHWKGRRGREIVNVVVYETAAK